MRYSFAAILVLLSFNCFTALGQKRTPSTLLTNAEKRSNNKASTYTLAQFDGRWQEKSRANSKTKEAVAVSDTLYLRFYDDNKVDTKEGNSVVATGSAEIMKDDYITTSVNDYKIISVSPTQIVLDDETNYIHTLTKRTIFSYEKQTAAPVAAPAKPNVVEITDANLTKNWFVYKRTANAGTIDAETILIRSLLISGSAGTHSYKGQVEFAKTGATITTESCTLVFEGSALTLTSATHTWHFDVYIADGKELSFGKEGEVAYYFKPKGN